MVAPNKYQLDAKDTAPATGAAVVAPNDATDLPIAPTRALYVGTTGDLKVNMADGTTVSFVAIPAGTVLPIAVTRVFATGQPGAIATNVLALY
jgi:hypothetical protein